MELLEEGLAQAISGDFRPQNVADTLWAYAKMGREPRERLMGLMEERAEAMFTSLSVSDTLLSYAEMGDDGEEAGGTADGAVGGADGDDIWGVHLGGCFRSAVRVCENGVDAGGGIDGVAGGAGGGDIRGVHLTECFRHVVGVCGNGEEAWERLMELLEGRSKAISGEIRKVVPILLLSFRQGRPHTPSVILFSDFWGKSFPFIHSHPRYKRQ